LIIVFYELSNLFDGLQYKILTFNQSKIDELFEQVVMQLDFILANLQKSPLVLFNNFTSTLLNSSSHRKTKYDLFIDRLNTFLEFNSTPNITIIDINKIIAKIGSINSVDIRNYRYNKAPYSIEFFKAYMEYIRPIILSTTGKTKKVLVVDCDNTLWKGILGEEGSDKIEMSSLTKDGSIFEDVQNLILSLVRKGVLLCLVSKNNSKDVDCVINSHVDMKIRNDDIVIKKVNWIDKATNLVEISRELNVGLDSIVFLDDSIFEIDSVTKLLPEVTVFQVPERLYRYPAMFEQEVVPLFYNLSISSEDLNKTKMYKAQTERNLDKNKFRNIDDYLASLNIKVSITIDNLDSVSRISQLTQKTNQFNLTSIRYTERDVEGFMEDERCSVISFSVFDKFGDSGLTGLCILKNINNTTVEIDTLLMSCRIIGRNIEYVFMDYLAGLLQSNNISKVISKYFKTSKNGQVSDFYDYFGFIKTDNFDDLITQYIFDLSEYKKSKITYIELLDE
jgi:FkbH-like protein